MELSDDEQALFAKFKEDYERDAVVPADEYISFNKLSSSAQDAWSEAREQDDYSIYAPYLQQLIALKRLRALLKEQALLEETMALASWDQLTGMPKDSGEFRAELQSYLTEKYLGVSTGDQAKALVAYFDEHASWWYRLDDWLRLVQPQEVRHEILKTIELTDSCR
ncbi:hypothetical protein H7R52_07145 [Weissella confusa]|uniref:Uncharacterized protein n=1 Tax=Weissella confusa TaxID=1583 RepID=A0A923SMY4_WEICO|nr:hypothetical protein [Weissella confusa]